MARRKTVEARVELAFVQPWFSATFLSVTCTQSCTCVGLSGSDGGTVVDTCEAGTLREHELEEDGVNVWSELSRRRKISHFCDTHSLQFHSPVSLLGPFSGWLLIARLSAHS